MWNRHLCLSILVLLVILAISSDARRRRYHVKHRTKHEHERRKVRSHEDCRMHEEFVKCGPEPHCEISCSNLFSPPNCMMSETLLKKCWYPKCVCKSGYARHENGHCVPEYRCEEFQEAAGIFASNRQRDNYPFIFGHPRQNNFW